MRALAHTLTGPICVVLLLGLLVMPSFPQESPAPYVLSRDVQLRANELDIWRQVVLDPSQTMRYLDTLTAADIIAGERARARGGSVPNEGDYDIGFGSECVFIPQKPLTPFLKRNSVRLRVALSGIYVSRGKRDAFAKSINPNLLRVTTTGLFAILGKLTDFGSYDREVINVRGL